MMKGFIVILLCNALLIGSYGQKPAVIYGQISDSSDGQALIGASVMIDKTSGTVSDSRGYYTISSREDSLTLTFKYAGYNSQIRHFDLADKDSILADIRLIPSMILLNEIVISAGRYEQKLSDVMVSLEIIKPDKIASHNTTSLESIIRQTSGVDIVDGQTSIRGGSGYSYGAGSRVLVLIDDLPILSADAGDVKWDYLPVENISQIEVIKGASSVLFGSSALNGVFNIRTSYPTSGSATRISLFGALYMKPKRDEMVWWDQQPVFAGLDFLHSRKMGNLDLVVGGNVFHDDGYKEAEFQKRIRLNANLSYRSKKVSGLSYGLNLNGMMVDKSEFFLWQDAGPGAYRQNMDAASGLEGNRFNIDPYVVYNTQGGAQHSLKTRFYHVSNEYKEAFDKDSRSGLFFGEYKYHKRFSEKTGLTAGISGTYSNTHANLYGNHESLNTSVFGQFDCKPADKLNLTAGMRIERYQLDDLVEYSKPVFRAGLNYNVFTYTFLRGSFGQGYRFPSIAEKHTATSLASLNIFPNPDLQSENGWSAEIGVKQGIKAGPFAGYADAAVFWTEYNKMIEFTFDNYGPDTLTVLDYFGFKALNVGNTRITGIDITFYGEGNLYVFPVSLMAGYTHMVPVDLDSRGPEGTESKFLKYRFRNSLKADLEVGYKRFTLGAAVRYNSRMERIDEIFLDPVFGELILPGFRDYWATHNTGYTVLDLRLNVDVTPFVALSLIVKNLLNREYMPRPGNIQAPRNVALRLNFSF
ncbi:MAG: TonB-dependent receptor [Bacteroidales bacterium]|nr:TonB-dependent receptor [Bacteroidales bacterium]